MRKILILMGRYLPGHKDGGPLRTIINVTEALGDEYEFYIGCLDRDHGDKEPYSNIRRNEWNQVGKAKVWYVSPGEFTNKLILELVEGKELLYLCSFYDDYGYKALLLKKRGKIKCPVALASMGVFSEGALVQKALKKKIFIQTLKLLGAFKNIVWSVTSEMEKKDVQKNIGKNVECVIAEDLPRSIVPGRSDTDKEKKILNVTFLSRISPKKNLIGAIRCLNKCRSCIAFTIYGPLEDEEYWRKCQKLLNQLPANVSWEYKGDVPSECVQEILAVQEVFLFPTLGENYGHVIFEALSVGCIPVISNQTPWEIIAEKNAGYVLSLTDDMRRFSEVIDIIANMPFEERTKMADRAINIAKEKVDSSRRETGYRIIFG
ncbi:glycosyltransferase [Dorea acetigenes]|jgi:glycosyltransferase involved in cell wall biosynthesis|uniref:Glycosyltransferase n=1 Tax=Dorea acetigenes TaxID=2981787 RepID=A0ABT2RNI4_9FIRM|nr:glycosyltransferase [Dorea acetigenes]MCB6415148.1 glycosyltransferase [Faecalimonas umbilicata]MCU6686965.1 glycosyltransferase [Dorea acetigenes]SCJ19263.1 N-acetyl-alpha-D-glucosaminyl L-malate synthase BshA [uncultured Clostridium sp.]